MKKPHTLLGALTLLLALIPLCTHLESNDNHLNYANHEYAKNLLNTLEPYSIFMTEGGDNQVFTTAYSQMAQHLRPDVRAYDQKGNVFYRVYGDFRYISQQEVDIKRDVVDSEIYSRGRPVYLTWRRSPNVAVCGDWFQKRYGLLFKVVPLKYRILEDLGADLEISLDEAHRLIERYYADKDVLEKKRKNLQAMEWYYPAVFEQGGRKIHFISDEERARLRQALTTYRDWLQQSLARVITPQFTQGLLRDLEKEGYLRVEGNRVVFVQDIESPFEGDYWDRYAFSYRNVPHAVKWTYLTREIFTNYNFYYAEYCREMMDRLTRQKAHYERKIQEQGRHPELLAAAAKAEEELERFTRLEDESYKSAAHYGYDMAVIFHNLGAINVRRDRLDDGVAAFRRGVLVDKYSYQTIYSYLLLRLRQASEREDPEFEKETVDEAARLVQVVLQRLQRTYAMDEEGFQKDQMAQLFSRFEGSMLAPRRSFPLQNVLAVKARFDKNPDDPAIQAEYASMLYYQRKDPDGVERAFKSAPESKWNTEMFVYLYGVALKENGMTGESFAVLERLKREKPYFFLAALRLGQMYEYLKNDRAQAIALYEEALAISPDEVRTRYPSLLSTYTESMPQVQRFVQALREGAN